MSSAIESLALGSFNYRQLKEDGDVLVPFITTVLCKGVRHHLRIVNIHAAALPFGFLESLELQSCTERPIPDFRIHLMKTTGQKVTSRCKRARTSVVYGEMNNDEDAADPDLKALKDSTNHELRFRMIAASPIVSLGIEFYAQPPESFRILYHGANVLDAGTEPEVARALLADKKPVKLRFPPIPPGRRLAAATRTLQALEGARERVGTGL